MASVVPGERVGGRGSGVIVGAVRYHAHKIKKAKYKRRDGGRRMKGGGAHILFFGKENKKINSLGRETTKSFELRLLIEINIIIRVQ